MSLGVILLPLLVLISGCSHIVDNKIDNQIECSIDSDCAPAGCSSQLCVSSDKSPDIITTCEYKEEYSCLRLTRCGCVDYICAWQDNKEYSECLEEVRV